VIAYIPYPGLVLTAFVHVASELTFILNSARVLPAARVPRRSARRLEAPRATAR